jgi:hypothetical protein
MSVRPPTDVKVGATFNRWTVISRSSRRPIYWNCICLCGTERGVKKCHLYSGQSASCGCHRDEVTSRVKTIHGGTSQQASPELRSLFRTWAQLRQRCMNPKNHAYVDYGARGIQVCTEWGASFETFVSDMGPRPPGTTLERKRNDEGYGPLNCVWATKTDQANNRRSNVFIEHDGRRQTIAQWARETGLKAGTIQVRVSKGTAPLSPLVQAKGVRK